MTAAHRQQSRFDQVVNGATKVVTLKPSPIGWEVKAWSYQIGAVKSYAEGDPYVHETFSDYQDAVDAFRLICHSAVDHPGIVTEPDSPMVDIAVQERIDDAARSEHRERERSRLDALFAQLEEQT